MVFPNGFIAKPIYDGMIILDISKTHFYDFWYSFLKKRLGEKWKLLYSGMVSFIISIRDIDAYEFIISSLDKFDTSEYQEDNISDTLRVNKKKLRYFKDE